MFAVKFGSQAKKFLKKSDINLSKRLLKRIEELAKDPFPSDTKRVVSQKKQKVFRIRVGEHRISYVVFHDKNELFIFEIDKRPRAY